MPTTPLTIRPATDADLTALAPHEPRSGLNLAQEHLARQATGEAIFATAWQGETPLGWCVLDLRESDLLPELSHLWVFPEARRRGVGRALTTWLEAKAVAAGHEEVFLLVDPDNTEAIPLYVDLDYSATGDHQPNVDAVTGEQGHHAIYRKSLTLR